MASLLKKGDVVAGVDIGGTKVQVNIFNHDFEALGQSRKKMRNKKDLPAEDRVLSAIAEALDTAGSPALKGIGVGSPGPLDPDTGVIIDTPNIAWKNFPLGKTISKAFGNVPVAVDNDVNVGTYGEWCFGVVKKAKNVVGVFPGTGIGGGIIVNGKLLHGFSGAAGEIGHITVLPDGPFCGCGKRGCLESLASRTAVAKELIALAVRGDAPYILEHCGTDITQVRSGAIARAIDAGEKMVEDEVRKAAYYVGIAVANLINILSPEAVVLGGGMVEAMETIYITECKRAIQEHAMPFLRKDVKVVPARLGDDAVVMGAARMIAERLK
jgi:glucokinase